MGSDEKIVRTWLLGSLCARTLLKWFHQVQLLEQVEFFLPNPSIHFLYSDSSSADVVLAVSSGLPEVRRGRLIDRLRIELGKASQDKILIAAPPSSGKSTLLCQIMALVPADKSLFLDFGPNLEEGRVPQDPEAVICTLSLSLSLYLSSLSLVLSCLQLSPLFCLLNSFVFAQALRFTLGLLKNSTCRDIVCMSFDSFERTLLPQFPVSLSTRHSASFTCPNSGMLCAILKLWLSTRTHRSPHSLDTL